MINDSASAKLGYQAETLVADSLIKKGYKLLERNYRKFFGEIDLIVQKDGMLIFVEVKMRTKSYFDLSEVITKSKQKKIMAVASCYLDKNNFHDKECRFDVALVQLQENGPEITYITNAFME